MITKALELKCNSIKQFLLEEIDTQLNDTNPNLSLDLITNLIASDRLKIKIAYLPDGGIYHEKIGYMADTAGNSVL